jgi:hypothetical protein
MLKRTGVFGNTIIEAINMLWIKHGIKKAQGIVHHVV